MSVLSQNSSFRNIYITRILDRYARLILAPPEGFEDSRRAWGALQAPSGDLWPPLMSIAPPNTQKKTAIADGSDVCPRSDFLDPSPPPTPTPPLSFLLECLAGML